MKVKAASLVLDMNLYPRHYLDEMCVADFVEALRAGATFPPIIADRKSKRVVDGWKRTTATLRFGGPDAEIEVEFRNYPNEEALLLEAIHLNAIHGERLTHHDLRRCVMLCERLKIDDEQVARALNLTLDKLRNIAAKEIHRDGEGRGVAASKQASVYLIEQDKAITERQQDALKGLVGLRQTAIINQVVRLVEGRILNKKDERIMEALEKLYRLLCEVFGKEKAA